MTAPVDIISAACTFPSGPTLALADCALRAQLALLSRHPSYVDPCGFKVRASYFSDSKLAFDAARWCALARHVLNGLADGLAAQGSQKRRRRLWLVLPRSGRGGVPADLADRLLASVQYERFDWEQIKTVRGGHAVGIHAIDQACAAVQAEGVQAVVLGVDSWLHPAALQSLEASRLLHGAHATHEGKAVPNP